MQRKLSAAHIRTLCGSGPLVQRRENLAAMLDAIGVTEADVRDAITPIDEALVRINRDAKAWTLAACGSAAIERYIRPREPGRTVHGWTALHSQARVRPWCPLAAAAVAYGMLPGDAPAVRWQQLADRLTTHPLDTRSPEAFAAWGVAFHNRINTLTGRPAYTPEQLQHVTPPPTAIDLVYLWVDGSDPAWQASYRQTLKREPPDGSRWVDAGELRASLESVARFAPWVRTIHLVTSGQRPAWLDDFPHVRLVTHAEIIPAKYLPTFNSHAIEPWIHNVPGLAEHFLYANDDTLFGADVRPEQFFRHDGLMMMPLAGEARGGGGGAYHAACDRAASVLDGLFGVRRWRLGWHHIKPYRRSMLAEIANRLPNEVARVSSIRQRSSLDLAWNGVLWPGYAIASGYGVDSPRGAIRGGYVGMDTQREADAMAAALKSRPHLLCVNNATVASAGRARAFLAAYAEASSVVRNAGISASK